MAARDDYPVLAHWDKAGATASGGPNGAEAEMTRALDEIDRLRAENRRMQAFLDAIAANDETEMERLAIEGPD